MHNLRKFCLVFIGCCFLLVGCSNNNQDLHIQRVGMLVENEIDTHLWNQKGEAGLEAIKDEFGVRGFIVEEVSTIYDAWEAVDSLVDRGVNLIFGHSSIYGEYFMEIANQYPEVHFVYFNGNYAANNITSLNFNSHAAGFFAGMIASAMSETKQIGIIAAYEWQPEVEGFYEGAKYFDSQIRVHVNYVNNWNSFDAAIETYEKMRKENVDVFYPAGDMYSAEVIQLAEEDGVYTIGFVDDQMNISRESILTSTIQDVDKLYLHIAHKFNDEELSGGIRTYGMQEGFIYLGEYNSKVPQDIVEMVEAHIETYLETNYLPNEN